MILNIHDQYSIYIQYMIYEYGHINIVFDIQTIFPYVKNN